MNKTLLNILAGLAVVAGPITAAAQGTAFTYQGRLEENGAAVPDGLYDFRFRVYTSVSGGTLLGTVSPSAVPVTNGLFTTRLDFGAGLFTGAARWLDTAVRTNGAPALTQLSPRTELTPTPYAIFAGGVPAAGISGTIAAANIGDGTLSGLKITDGSIQTADLENGAVTAAKFGNDVGVWSRSGANIYYSTGNVGVGRVPLVPLHVDGIIRSSGTNGGIVQVYNPSNGTAHVDLSWLNDQARIRVGGAGNGALNGLDIQGTSDKSLLYVSQAGDARILESLSIGSNVFIDNFESGGGAQFTLRNAVGGATVDLDADEGDGSAGFSLLNSNGVRTVYLDANLSGGSYFRLRDGANETRAVLIANSLGVSQGLYNSNTVSVISLDTSSDAGSRIALRNMVGNDRVILDGADTNRGGFIDLRDTNGTYTVQISGAEIGSNGGQIEVFNTFGTRTIQMDGDDGGNGGIIALYDSSGNETIRLDANATGGGRVTAQVIEITGGADLSEKFDINAIHESLRPGMVVSIDPKNPGELVVSSTAYDKKVAGIVSGAAGVKPGMLMGQSGTAADGQHPVALTGRVYCWVDADASGAIEPGDLITTSATPGHGMKVADHARAGGAVIGKAMTPLAQGKGLVLVLVNLQ